jgi:isoquinoline 1-oxidoreductase beta subunit
MSQTFADLSRRSFLGTAAAGATGLVIGLYLPSRHEAVAAAGAADNGVPIKLNAWVHIAPDDTITFYIHKAEMGQGTVTSLSQILAEELECDWSKIRTAFPGVDRGYGPSQGVFGSSSIRQSWTPLRNAGATARQMLTFAAAARWGVAPEDTRADAGFIINNKTGARLSYGALTEAAAALPVPATPPLKDAKLYRHIGRSPRRLDTKSKVNGTASFGLDFYTPGMLYAVIARCPVFGGTVTSIDDTKAKLVPGVKQVVHVSTGVAVVADTTWAAMKGRDALSVTWNEGSRAGTSSAGLRQLFADLAATSGAEAKRVGDAPGTLASAAKTISATYEVPYLAHAPMEPLNCSAHVRPDGCDVWASSQNQSAAQQVTARVTGLPPEKIAIHTLYMGGGFGRRAGSDYVGEAVEISKAISAPVKLTWTREDDMQHDTYRPASLTWFKGGVDAEGWPVAIHARVACPSFNGPRPGVDRTAVEGTADLAYTLPHFLVEYHNPDAGIPVSYWRSVGYSQNCFFSESFLDELCALGGRDPLAVRRRLLSNQPRLLAALDLAAAKFDWTKPLPPGHGRGIAVNNNIGSFTAQIAEASVDSGRVKIHRIVCAVDCGQVVNPAIVAQQIESGIAYGLSAMLNSAITIERGRVVQRNFNDYEPLRLIDMPAIVETHIVPSAAAPGGIGEASTPSVAPAVANALFAATGTRLRRLPVRAADLA